MKDQDKTKAQLIDELNEMRRLRQDRKMETIRTMAGGIAHEFNNILMIILGNTELAVDGMPVWDRSRKYLEEIKTAAIRGRDVVQQLLSVNRKPADNGQPVEIRSVVQQTVKALRETVRTGIAIESRIDEDVPFVMGIAAELELMTRHLCRNAADAMDAQGGFIRLQLERASLDRGDAAFDKELASGSYVKLTVSDTGCGMNDTVLNRIFDPYFTTKNRSKGTGMGLFIVLGIVKRHGGAIRVASEKGKGTAFEVFLPAFSAKANPLPLAAE